MRITAVAVVLMFAPLLGCGKDAGPSTLGQSGTITLSSTAFVPAGPLPVKYDGDHGTSAFQSTPWVGPNCTGGRAPAERRNYSVRERPAS